MLFFIVLKIYFYILKIIYFYLFQKFLYTLWKGVSKNIFQNYNFLEQKQKKKLLSSAQRLSQRTDQWVSERYFKIF